VHSIAAMARRLRDTFGIEHAGIVMPGFRRHGSTANAILGCQKAPPVSRSLPNPHQRERSL
jgi:hypothetical protein